MVGVDGAAAEVIAQYLEDEDNKFYKFVSITWDDLTGFLTGRGRYDYSFVVNVLNYFSENFHTEDEKKEYRRELGLKKSDLNPEVVAQIVKETALIYGIVLADTESDYLENVDD